jgi:PAS domain S-box-containing protein
VYNLMVVPGRRKSQQARENSKISYVIAVASVLAVTLMRASLAPLLGGTAPLLAYTLAVSAAAYVGGFIPGVVTAALSATLGTYLFASDPRDPAYLTSMGLFTAACLAISTVCEKLRGSTARAALSEERFRLLVEGATDIAIFALDLKGNVASWNAGAERLKGYQSEEILGRHLGTFYPEEDQAAGRPQLALRTATEHGVFHDENWRVRKDGSRFWAEVVMTALKDSTGQITGFSKVTRDVTERRENRETTQALLESAAQGIIGVNADGKIVIVNAMAEQLFGYTRQELIGSTIEMLLPAKYATSHVAQRHAYFATPRNRPMGLGLPLSGRRKDGTEFPVEISLSSVQSRHGRIAVSFVTDISSRRAAEQEREALNRKIAEERERLRIVIDQMPVGVILAENPGSRFVLHNREAERLLAHEIVAPSPDNPFGAEDASGRRLSFDEYPLIRALNTGEQVQHAELLYRRADNSVAVLFVSASPIRDSTGQVVAAVTAFSDISERKLAEQERERLLGFLERSNDDLRQFGYAASHDLQEPLRMVTSYTQLLLRRYGSQLDPDAIQYIEYAVTGALRIENLLKALREYWHISEVTERQPVWTDCNSVVDHALQNLEGTIREVDAIITRDALPTVLADQTPLLQLFQNLIGNALKYRHPDRRPAVHIRATAGVGEWVFSVRDNGIGIDPQYAKQVFGLFKRLNGYRYGGAGMGLAICQKIAERFGGRIWVDSQLGEGASFYFTIPTNIERQVDTTSGDGQATRPAPAAGSHR